MATEINKGIEAFEATTDFSRNNPDRKPWGKSDNASGLHIGNEYEPIAAPPPDVLPVTPPADAPPAPKFTHKLADGTELKADTVEDLAAQIEKALKVAPPTPEDFEDKPLYEGHKFERKELSLPQQAEILNLWKENPQAALRKLQEAEVGATMDTLIKVLNDSQMALRVRLEMEAGAEFLGEEETYNPTPANGKKLTEYLASKGKPITVKNLRVAFHQLVSAGDKTLLTPAQPPAPPAPEENLEEHAPPPTIVPANQGLPPAATSKEVDVAAFAKLPLSEQQKFFTRVRRA